MKGSDALKETEQLIKDYFNNLKRLEIEEERLQNEIKRIEILRKCIKDCDISLSTDLGSIDYSTERVQATSDNKSHIERELDKTFNAYISTLRNSIKHKNILEANINNLKYEINDMNIIMKRLKEEDMDLLKLIYYENKSYREIELEGKQCISIGTITKNKNRILDTIKNYNNAINHITI